MLDAVVNAGYRAIIPTLWRSWGTRLSVNAVSLVLSSSPVNFVTLTPVSFSIAMSCMISLDIGGTVDPQSAHLSGTRLQPTFLTLGLVLV